MNKIKNMYGAITADEAVVERAIRNARHGSITRPFIWKKVLATAACLAMVSAVIAIPISAGGGGFSQMQEYGEEQMKEAAASHDISQEKAEDIAPRYDVLSRYTNTMESADMICESGGVRFSQDSAYYDGTMLYLSFIGEYDDALCERLMYTPTETDDAFLINGESVVPMEGSFCLFRRNGIYAGVVSFSYPSDRNYLALSVSLPYLQGMDANGENEVGEPKEGPFSFDAVIYRTYTENLTAENVSLTEDGIYISSVQSTPAALTVQYFVDTQAYPQSVDGEIRCNMQALPVADDGTSPTFIEGYETQVEGGVLKTAVFSPVVSDKLVLVIYDKNDYDGCGKEICEKARFDITLK